MNHKKGFRPFLLYLIINDIILYGIFPLWGDVMARIDIRDLDDETIKQLDEQCKKYGINSRSDYIRMLIKLDIMTNIVQRIINDANKQ